MKNHKKIVCLIPARGGSKRIKNKNLKTFHGKPIIYYSIINAMNSGIFSNVFVSSDSKKIIDFSKKNGAEAPFVRAANLSDDKAILKNVIKDFVNKINLKKNKLKYICCLMPTAPLINSNDLKKAYKQITKFKADALISVSTYNNHPLKSLKINNKKYLSYMFKQYQRKNTQNLRNLYQDAGAFYIYEIKSLFKLKKNLFPYKTIPYFLPLSKSVDINNNDDFVLAEKLFQKK